MIHVRSISALRSVALASALALAPLGCDDGGSTTPPEEDMTTECTPGEAGCECDSGMCQAVDDEGNTLVCSAANVCEAETCTVGDTGCACAVGDECASMADECVSGLCQPRTACEGELGCACLTDGGCTEGACVDGTCQVANGVLINVAGGDARGCEVLIDAGDVAVSEVVFPAGVRGAFKTRGGRTGVSFIRTEDSALLGVAATVVLAADAAESDAIAVVSAKCVDRLGDTDASAAVEVR